MQRFILIFCVLWSFFFINSVHSETLKIGISTNYPPVAFKEKNNVVGIEADLAKSVGQQTGMAIEFVETPWDELETALNMGDVDVIMSGVSITDERKKRFDFTEPYMTVGQMALIKSDNIMNLSSKVAMYSSGKRFGVENNTTGQKFVKQEFPDAQIVSLAGVKQGIKALKDNKIDYFIHDAPTIWQYTVLPKTQDTELFGLYEYLTIEPLAWVVKKGNANLLEKLNKALNNLQSRGVVNKIINRWIPLTIEVGKK